MLAAVDQHRAGVGPLRACNALDEGALAGTVFAEQRVHRAGRDLHRHAVHRGEAAEPLGQLEGLERQRPYGRSEGAYRLIHADTLLAAPSASSTAADSATAPNTPPCIVTILSAAR